MGKGISLFLFAFLRSPAMLNNFFHMFTWWDACPMFSCLISCISYFVNCQFMSPVCVIWYIKFYDCGVLQLDPQTIPFVSSINFFFFLVYFDRGQYCQRCSSSWQRGVSWLIVTLPTVLSHFGLRWVYWQHVVTLTDGDIFQSDTYKRTQNTWLLNARQVNFIIYIYGQLDSLGFSFCVFLCQLLVL